MITNETKEIYNKIINWECEVGESFLDCFSESIMPSTFMPWCLGRKHLSIQKYNDWLASFFKDELEAECLNYYLYNEENDEASQFAVVISDEYNEADKDKAYYILSEFISEMDIYKERLNQFLKES